jgi:hypothetical protein
MLGATEDRSQNSELRTPNPNGERRTVNREIMKKSVTTAKTISSEEFERFALFILAAT